MSRPRSGRGASGGGGGKSKSPSARGVYVQSPKSDIFVVLLGISLGAMIIGCVLMGIVLNRYGFSTKVTANGNRPAPFAVTSSIA